MKTIKTMRESFKEYLKPENVKVTVVIQNSASLKASDTIMESTLNMEDACRLFGNYEMILSNIATYEDGEYKFPCIRVLLRIPEEVN